MACSALTTENFSVISDTRPLRHPCRVNQQSPRHLWKMGRQRPGQPAYQTPLGVLRPTSD